MQRIKTNNSTSRSTSLSGIEASLFLRNRSKAETYRKFRFSLRVATVTIFGNLSRKAAYVQCFELILLIAIRHGTLIIA